MTQLSFNFNTNICDRCGLPLSGASNTGGICQCPPVPALLKGWVCPKCDTPWSPYKETCTNCNPRYLSFNMT